MNLPVIRDRLPDATTYFILPYQVELSAVARQPTFRFKHITGSTARSFNGGPAHLNLFDCKPSLNRGAAQGKGNLLASPYRFAQHSEAGAWVSEAFPKLAEKVDDQSMAIRIGYSVIGLGCLVGVGFLIVNAVRK